MSDTCSRPCATESSDPLVPGPIPTSPAVSSYVSEFVVSKMDCPSEEGMIRLSLECIEPSVALQFDIPNRKVKVFHEDTLEEIKNRMESLGLGARLKETRIAEGTEYFEAKHLAESVDTKEASILKWLLFLNATMFVVELVFGWVAQSTGLIADSLDMLADATVYGLALYAVGRSVKMKLHAAHMSGWLQVILALGALSEVLRRFIFGSDPVSSFMMGLGMVALIVNVSCLFLIFKTRDSGAHMKASWIFSANDVIANLGLILAGFLVALTGSRYPDLVIGLIIGVIVLNGARRILSLKA